MSPGNFPKSRVRPRNFDKERHKSLWRVAMWVATQLRTVDRSEEEKELSCHPVTIERVKVVSRV